MKRSIILMVVALTVFLSVNTYVSTAFTNTAVPATLPSPLPPRGPWDDQGIIIWLDRGVYWPNDTMHIGITLIGNFSNTLIVWLSIENDSGTAMWQENWQPNATALQQGHTILVYLPPDAVVGHYTVIVQWDHRMATEDYWIAMPVDAVPVPEFTNPILFVVLSLGMIALAKHRKVIN